MPRRAEAVGVGVELRWMRRLADLTGPALAESIGINTSMVSRLETGRRHLTKEKLLAWRTTCHAAIMERLRDDTISVALHRSLAEAAEKIGSEEYRQLLLRLAEATAAGASNDVHILRESPGRLARDRWGAGQAIQEADVGPQPRTVDVHVDHCPAPPDIAEVLGLGSDQLALRRSRRFMLADRAVQTAVSWLDPELVAGTPITAADSGPGGIYARLAELGHEPVRFREVVRAGHADPDVRTQFELPAGTRTFAITRYAYDAGDRCVEVNEMTLDAAVYVLAYDFPA